MLNDAVVAVNDGTTASVVPVDDVLVMPVISTFQSPVAVPVPLIYSDCEKAAYATEASTTTASAATKILLFIYLIFLCVSGYIVIAYTTYSGSPILFMHSERAKIPCAQAFFDPQAHSVRS